ncbi:MAG: histidine phosphatase family protein [bacterium]
MTLKNNYFLLRHGQTIYQKENRKINYPADADYSLTITEEGKEMIKKVAEQLKSEKIDLIFASPFLRTKQSAEIVSDILGIENINYDERIIDIKMGEFANRSHEEYANFFANEEERFTKRPRGGENWNDIIARTKTFLNDTEKQHKDKNILIISHGDPIWLMAGILKGFEEPEQFLASKKTENNLYPKVGELIKI